MQNDAFGDSYDSFGILASTYTSTATGTVITGDLGYTKGPAVVPIVSGSTHVADSVYSKAGIAQNTATSSANSQACTTNLGTTVNLSQVNGGVYTPGVYCTTGAASIGTNGITLSGNGIYIFKIDGALTTVVNSDVTLTNGAQASKISWVPTQATTLGANSHLIGDVHGAPVIIGANSDINGVGPAKIMADVVKVIPEFGTIAAMILIVSIVSVIAISAKSRLGIMPRY